MIDACGRDDPTPTSILNFHKVPLSVMVSTEEVQEVNPRGIPKAPFIVSLTGGQPSRAVC